MPDPFITGDAQDPSRPWYVRHRMRALLATAMIPLAVGVVCFLTVWLVIQRGLKHHPVYAQALAMVRGSELIGAELGGPLEPGFLVTGQTDDGAGTAEMMFNLAAPHGQAGVRVVGRRDAEPGPRWRITFLDVGAKLSNGRDKVYTLVGEEKPMRFADEAEQTHIAQ